MGRIQHQSGDLFNRKPARQILRPLPGGQPPVLIRQKFARPFQILEIQSILLDQLKPRILRPGQAFAAGRLGQTADTVVFALLLMIRRLLGKYYICYYLTDFCRRAQPLFQKCGSFPRH